jgi:hypothetical protein
MSYFTFKKPITWKYMPLYEKIKYYSTIIDEHYAPYIDKIAVKHIVREMCPTIQTAVLVRVLSSPHDICDADLNPNHLLKAAHGCGWNIRLDGSTPIEKIRENLLTWITNYSKDEKQYTYVKPAFFIETIINDKYTGSTGQARVFMFRCIRGKPISVGVRHGRGDDRQNSYTPEFKFMDTPVFEMTKPSQWETMLEKASILSARFEFVRVDFYIGVDEEIYFSEFTFTPAGGNRVFSMDIERKLGKLW